MGSSSKSESFSEKIKRMSGNFLQSTGLCCFKFSENAHIQVLDARIASRKKQFGMDYLTLVQSNATQNQLKKCLQDAL